MINGTGDEDVFTNGAMTIYPGMSSDELINYAGVGNQLDNEFAINNLSSRSSPVKQNFWTPAYKLIFNANSIIEGIAASTSNQLTPAARKQITAEARVIRAFTYFYLVNLFGDIPLVTGTDWKQNALASRSASAKVYEQIVADLLEAEKDLPEDFTAGGGERIRVNKMVARALLARVYLYQKDWENAAAQATAVINNNQFVLEPQLENVFLATSRESIWQLKPSVSKPTYQFTDAINFTPTLWWTDIPVDLRPLYMDPAFYPDLEYLFYPFYILTNPMADAFESNDKRKEKWTSFIETPTYAPYTGVTNYFPVKYVGGGKKYYTVLRLAEQVLIRAEAKAQLNDLSGADQDINAIRLRAGLSAITSTSQSDALNRIAKERRTELFSEWGHRWLDLKRTGKALEALALIPQKKTDPNQLLYPIPIDEIQADPNLTQNPGY
jgi:hypothetical protein